jgi:hypothetical protein
MTTAEIAVNVVAELLEVENKQLLKLGRDGRADCATKSDFLDHGI